MAAQRKLGPVAPAGAVFLAWAALDKPGWVETPVAGIAVIAVEEYRAERLGLELDKVMDRVLAVAVGDKSEMCNMALPAPEARLGLATLH